MCWDSVFLLFLTKCFLRLCPQLASPISPHFTAAPHLVLNITSVEAVQTNETVALSELGTSTQRGGGDFNLPDNERPDVQPLNLLDSTWQKGGCAPSLP